MTILPAKCLNAGGKDEPEENQSNHQDYEELQHNNFDEACSSKRRTYSNIPIVKDRFYRNLERKRTREQKQSHGDVIDSEVKTKPSSPAAQNNDTSTEDATGYNSEDEYSDRPINQLTAEEWRQRDLIFAKSIKKRGFIIKPMIEDGACLFRAIADQVYGDQEMHDIVRTHCMDYIVKNRDYYCAYVTEDFNKYVTRKRHNFVQGNHLEIQALSEMYHRPIEVYCYQLKPINIFHGAQKSDYEPIRLSYQRASHYNSIINPFKPSVGVGLGLPGESNDAEKQLIEQTMLEDKLKATDWEATNEVIEEQVARESYLQWCKDNEKRRKQANSSAGSSSTVTSASSGDSRGSKSPEESSSVNSQLGSEDSSEEISKDSIFSRLPPEVFGLQDWEDADVMARVLAASQEEYLDNLKATRQNTASRF